MKTILPLSICLLLLLPGAASAVKLYKWVDKDGNVTYQESPPPADAGKVEEKNIDPDANVIQADHPAPDTTPTRRRNGGNGQGESGDTTDTGAQESPSLPLLHEGDRPDGQAPNPLPPRTPPPVAAPPSLIAPPPPLAPPPALPPPAPLPPPPPGGAH
jgi:hypothetical protein